jgi:hydrogenase expression/formation protein HypC
VAGERAKLAQKSYTNAMCLAIPAKIISIQADNLAGVDLFGVERTVALDLVPQARVGDYLLVHAGFGIEVISEDAARETLDLIAEFPELLGMQPESQPDSQPNSQPDAQPGSRQS